MIINLVDKWSPELVKGTCFAEKKKKKKSPNKPENEFVESWGFVLEIPVMPWLTELASICFYLSTEAVLSQLG